MNIEILQPADNSLQAITQTIDNNEILYRSPHVGNVNNTELNLLFGIDELGGQVQVELVDSIRGDDRYANPRVALVGDDTITLASRNYAKSRVVGACAVDPIGLERLSAAGLIFPDKPPTTLQELHIGALVRSLPASIAVLSSSRYFAGVGAEMYGAALDAAKSVIDRPVRYINTEGKIEADDAAADKADLFGFGDNPSQGRVAPLEAMMALEIIKAAVERPGQDQRIVHIGGPDMVHYTGQPEIMGPTKLIAAECLARLGLTANVTVEYVVPCMKTIVDSPDFNARLDTCIRSQYDLLVRSAIGASR